MTFTLTSLIADTFTLPHNLNTTHLIVTVYHGELDGSEMLVPFDPINTLRLVDSNTVSVHLTPIGNFRIEVYAIP